MPRRKVALRNLELCFPRASVEQRTQWARRALSSLPDLAGSQLAVVRPQSVVEQRVKLQGAVANWTAMCPTIIFAPHFYGLDAGGLVLPLHVPGVHVHFSTHPDPVIDVCSSGGPLSALRRAVAQPRQVRPSFPTCARGLLTYSSDMDFGAGESIFVPHGVPAATVPSLSRFARPGPPGGIGMYTRLTPDGYVAERRPRGISLSHRRCRADTARMNRELESYINTMPGQYYWVHKRFKDAAAKRPGQAVQIKKRGAGA